MQQSFLYKSHYFTSYFIKYNKYLFCCQFAFYFYFATLIFYLLYNLYLLNYILPYKLGDLVRAWISGRKMKNGKPLGLSTVIVDRYFDIVSVGFIFLVLSIANRDKSELLAMAGFYIVVAIVLLVVAFALYFIRGTVKKAISIYAKVFNKHIESVILCFAWALIWNFKDIFQKISKIKLILSTVGMWILYLISYYLFSGFLASFGEGITWIDVFTMLFAQNSISSSTGNVTLFWKNESISMHLFYMASYMAVPLILMLVIKQIIRQLRSRLDLRIIPMMQI